jgi:pyruvate dehydrogenase E1 component alpha subunit
MREQPETFTADLDAIRQDRDLLLDWYTRMLLMRRFEERCTQLYGQLKIKGFLHLYIGQEAVGVGLEAAIRPDDQVITAYRDHGNALARGMSARSLMAELYGKETGCVKGRGGSMHMFSAEYNFYGGHGLVGQQIALGAGIALANQYQGNDKVCVCLFGDGAARQGVLHETFNMAMLWNLPVVFICENNQYAMGTSVERTSNVTDIYKLGRGYEMPSEQVNGMDVFAVYESVLEAAQAARDGQGPTLLEMRTYRFRGHSISDPAKYRTREELDEFKGRDPIIGLKSHLVEHAMATESDFEEIEAAVKAQVQDAVDFAEQSDFPSESTLYDDVYAQADYPFLRA